MGVRGSGGVGGGIPRHRPSHVAYYVALGGILALLTLLLLYFFYFFIKKVKKFSSSSELSPQPSSSCRPPSAAAYPVQPVVREGASEMARLCKQVPPPGKGGTVFPTSTSPAAIRTDTGEHPPGPLGELEGSAPGPPPPPGAPEFPPAPDPALLKAAPPITVTAPAECVTVQ